MVTSVNTSSTTTSSTHTANSTASSNATTSYSGVLSGWVPSHVFNASGHITSGGWLDSVRGTLHSDPGALSVADLLALLGKNLDELVKRADQVRQGMSPDDSESKKAEDQAKLAKYTAMIEELSKLKEKLFQVVHTTSTPQSGF